jgi:DNA repair exonuclease SbcCD ATPase subunit
MSKFIQALKPTGILTAIAVTVFVGGVCTPSNVHAQEAESETAPSTTERQSTSSTEENKNRLREQREALEAKKQELQAAKDAAEARVKARHEAQQEKLSASQLEICNHREANINNRIMRIGDRSTKYLTLFNSISERAQDFYANKGNTLSNYGELIADVSEKKVAAEAAVGVINEMRASFNCDSANPKSAVDDFKVRLQTAVTALKEYRTSVKNLIVGIKSVNKAAGENTTSTTDEATP